MIDLSILGNKILKCAYIVKKYYIIQYLYLLNVVDHLYQYMNQDLYILIITENWK